MKKLLLLLLCVALAGCASVGNKIDVAQTQNIKKGETTRADLEKMFGPPTSIGLGSDGKLMMVWVYAKTKMRGSSFIPVVGGFVGGADTEIQQLQVWIDNKTGLVLDWAVTQGNQPMGMGTSAR